MSDLFEGLSDWDNGRDPVGLWMSEKHDGVFATWNGFKLTTKNGHPINAPSWWMHSIPKNFHYDGELWMGRGLFQRTVSCVRKKVPIDIEWQHVAYMVFNVPVPNIPWIDRFKVYTQPPVVPVMHYLCHNKEQMLKFLNTVIENGGEGIVLRDPTANYVWKKDSGVAWRVVPELTSEAIVTAIEPGDLAGKNHNKMGALTVKWDGPTWKGVVFKIGTGFTDAVRATPPPIGATIQFKYSSLTDDGIPKRAVYLKTL